jgi:peroxiredoxin Q/BCP
VCSLRDAAKDFEAQGVRVFGASTDDVRSQQAFAKAQELDFPLLSDPDGSLTNKYGVAYPGRAMAQRVTFLIDPEGILRHIDRSVDVSKHGSDLVALVKKLKSATAR